MLTLVTSLALLALIGALAMALGPDAKIKRNIRFNRQSFGPGREADLLNIATPEQLQQWQQQGLITGDWGNDANAESSITGSSEQSSPPQLESIVGQIISSLGIQRHSDETPLQFLSRFAETATEVAEDLNQRERAATQATQRLETATQELDTLQSRYNSLEAGLGSLTRERDEAQAAAEQLRLRLAALEESPASPSESTPGDGAAAAGTGKAGKK